MKLTRIKTWVLIAACSIGLLNAQNKVTENNLTLNGMDTQALTMILVGDSLEIEAKWAEFTTRHTAFTNKSSTAMGQKSLNGSMADIGRTSEGIMHYKVILKQNRLNQTTFYLLLKSVDGEYLNVIDEVTSNELKYILNEFSTYVNTGFIKEDVVPTDNLPEEKLENMKPIEQDMLDSSEG